MRLFSRTDSLRGSTNERTAADSVVMTTTTPAAPASKRRAKCNKVPKLIRNL